MTLSTWTVYDGGAPVRVEVERGAWVGTAHARVNGTEVARSSGALGRARLRFRLGMHRAEIRVANDAVQLAVDGRVVADGAQLEALAAISPDLWTELDARRMRGASWFSWIAALGLLNALLYAVGADLGFPLGTFLGFVAQGLLDAFGIAGAVVAHAAVFAIFYWCGRRARAGSFRAFVVGALVYSVDLLIALTLESGIEWGIIAFHALALFFIARGALAQRALARSRVVSPA